MSPPVSRPKKIVRVRDNRQPRPAVRNRNRPTRAKRQEVANQKLAEKMAPILMIHPNEKAFPMNPNSFVRMSRFRMHRKFKRDKGFNKIEKEWVTTNSKDRTKYVGIPVETINRYGLDSRGKNRRPRDKKNGSASKVFLQPMGSLRGNRNPTGRIPAYYYIRRQGIRNDAPKRTFMTYWYFFGDNPTPPLGHQGDWVHATLSILPSGQLEGIWFSRHGITPVFQRRNTLQFRAGRPLVFISKASHGNWPKAGTFKFERTPNFVSKTLKKAGFADETSGNGVRWDISKRLEPLHKQPWRNYAGAWGEVGELPETTGPLGPWHKRSGK